MTLAWIKAQIWKNSADIVIQYKANGEQFSGVVPMPNASPFASVCAFLTQAAGSKAIHPRGNQLWYDPK